MSRVKPVFKPSDYPGEPDDQTRADLEALFTHLFPGVDNPEIDAPHTGMAIAAHSPRFALALSTLTRCAVLDLVWAGRPDLTDLAIQTVNLVLKSGFSFEARLGRAEASGLGLDRLAALPLWRESSLFDDEQRLVIEYTMAVVTSEVSDELHTRACDRFGVRDVVELTALISTFSLWAMFINASGPSLAPSG